MSNFIKDAIAELEHVVWPTPNETRKYMTYTVGVIVILGTFLAVLGFVLREGLLAARAQFPHDAIATTVSGEEYASTSDLSGMLEQIAQKTSSGKTLSGDILTGATTTLSDSGTQQ